MEGTETIRPEPSNEAMFREIEEKSEDIYNIDSEYGDASKHCYSHSLVREDVYITEDGKDAGRTAFGKHANRNKSI